MPGWLPVKTSPAKSQSHAYAPRTSSIPPSGEYPATRCSGRALGLLYSCQGEVRECVRSNTFDVDFAGFLSAWHSACDRHLPGPLTTASLFSLSIVPKPEICGRFTDACSRWTRDFSGCMDGREEETATTSCACSTTSMLSLASVCEVDGNRSCLLTTADFTHLWEYRNCPNAAAYYARSTVGRLGNALHYGY